MTELDVEELLYRAIERVAPYTDRIPPSAAQQVHVAKLAYEIKQARRQIVQTPAVAKEITLTKRILEMPSALLADARDPDQVGEAQ